MKQVVGLPIKCLTYGQKHHQIEVRLCGLYGQWEEHGFVPMCGNIILIKWTKQVPAYPMRKQKKKGSCFIHNLFIASIGMMFVY
jgi:hypothetical protein